MMTIRRLRQRVLIGIGAIVAVLVSYVLFPWPIPPARSFELVAHRGVHQTFPLRDLTAETCTSEIIYPPSHSFLENTIPSMWEAFALGATAVELDIHRTADDQLVVFHDWALDCRTEGSGVTNEQTLDTLQRLDVGYGYTADGGQTFPLRGTGIGMMPTLPDVLVAFPEERLVIHNKDGGAETTRLLAGVLQTLPPEQRARVVDWGEDRSAFLHEMALEVQAYIYDAGERKACYADFLFRMLAMGTLSAECRMHIIGIPVDRLEALPGWPNLILARAHQAGARVFITDVDSEEHFAAVSDLPIDGIQTNRIELIGPLMTDTNRIAAPSMKRQTWCSRTPSARSRSRVMPRVPWTRRWPSPPAPGCIPKLFDIGPNPNIMRIGTRLPNVPRTWATASSWWP